MSSGSSLQSPSAVRNYREDPRCQGSLSFPRWQFLCLNEITSGLAQRAFIEYILFESQREARESGGWTPPLPFRELIKVCRISDTGVRLIVRDAVKRGLIEMRSGPSPRHYQFRALVENWLHIPALKKWEPPAWCRNVGTLAAAGGVA